MSKRFLEHDNEFAALQYNGADFVKKTTKTFDADHMILCPTTDKLFIFRTYCR